MPMLPSRNYVSEHTQFIRKLLESKPDLAKQQHEGRAIWWDKAPQDLSDQKVMDEGRVAQPPYVYGTD